MGAITKVNIANRALQHVGAIRISTFQDAVRNAQEIAACYDAVRQACMRSAAWRFAMRRVALRKITTTGTKAITFPAWAVGTTYAQGFVVTGSDGFLYRSLVASNTGNDPTLDVANANWTLYYGNTTGSTYDSGTSYFAGEIVIDSTPATYISLTNGNSGNTPSSGAPWLVLTGATTAAYFFTEALGYGSSSTGTAKNAYRLPYGFMRLAPQDPKAPATTVAGTSGNIRYKDWEYSGNYLLTADASPVMLNCIVDIGDPSAWDPLFREFNSARLALELVEIITQDPTKMQLVGTIYQRYRNEARQLNKIEIGSTEAEDEEYEPEYQLVGPQPAPGPVAQGPRQGQQ